MMKKRYVFSREAKAASSLDHPNICTVYETGETGDGQSFIAMAYYEGETLKSMIANNTPPLFFPPYQGGIERGFGHHNGGYTGFKKKPTRTK